MLSPTVAWVDAQLATEWKVWRWQRLDGAHRDIKRATLDRIDQLLEQRHAISHATPATVQVTA